jgi:hypothetical protein
MGATTLSAQVEDEELQQKFEDWKEERCFDSRSEAIRAAIRKAVIDTDPEPAKDNVIMQGIAAGLIALMSIVLGQTWLMHGIEAAAVMFLLVLASFGGTYALRSDS